MPCANEYLVPGEHVLDAGLDVALRDPESSAALDEREELPSGRERLLESAVAERILCRLESPASSRASISLP